MCSPLSKAAALPRYMLESEMQGDRRSAPIPRVIELYGLGRSTIYKLLKSGSIMGFKVGRRTLIDIESVEAFLSAQPRYLR